MMKYSLATRFYLYFAAIIIIALSTISIAGYWRSSNELEKQYQGLLAQIVDNVIHQTDLFLKNFERVTVSMMVSPLTQDAIDNAGIADPFTKTNAIKNQIFQPILITNPEISMVYLEGYNGFQAIDFNSQIPNLDYKAFQEYVDELNEVTRADGGLTIQDSAFLDGHLTFARKVSLRPTSKKFNGLVGFELKNSQLTTLWKGITLGNSGYFFIVSDRGKILYHPDPERIGKQLNGQQFEIVQQNMNHVYEFPDEKGRLYFSRKSDYSGWTLIASMSVNEYKKPISSLRLTIFYVGLATLVVATFLALRLGQSIIKPVRMLENAMRRTEKGQWAKVPLTGKRDEMDRLIASYNTMVSRLEEMVEQVYETELRNKENLMKRHLAEFQSLQLQINPHFLYNTLETIICYAVIQKSSEIKDIVRSLSYMLRYSIRTDLEDITVVNELKHVMHFMSIMKYRLQRDFEIDVRIPSDLLLKHMVRLTLQPIIENIFKHAFPNGVNDQHHIIIDAWTNATEFVVQVEDNGCGMDPETLKWINARLASAQSSEKRPETTSNGRTGTSIGLINVHNRIQIVYGDQFGLSIISEPKKGTRVLIRMPR